jgi:hypothetical protein
MADLIKSTPHIPDETSRAKQPMRQAIWPLLTASFVLFVALAVVGLRIPGKPPRLAYPTDDTYIALAMAANLADHGNWGINPGEFAPASSSPLWHLILAGVMKMAGVHVWIPFALSLLCAFALLILVDFIGRRENWPPYLRALVLVLVVIVMPLAPLSILGLEHVLHTLLTVYVLYLIWRLPEPGQPASTTYVASLLSACLLSTAARYEGLFLVAAVALVLFWQRRWPLALGIVAAAMIPVVLHGLVSLAHDWSWLPSSVRLKGNFANQGTLLEYLKMVCARINENSHPVYMVATFVGPLMALAILPASNPRNRSAICLVSVFLLTLVQHMAFARIGWFFRYEAYLLVAQILVIGLLVASAMPPRVQDLLPRLKTAQGLAIFVLVLCLAMPQLKHGLKAIMIAPRAMKNICDQQGEMAEFVHRYYPDTVVAANDIGALCFYGQARIIDLVGLVHRGIFQARVAARYDTPLMDRICRDEGVGIAIVYDSWFQDGPGSVLPCALPRAWRLAGTLRIEDNVICGEDIVSFYAVVPEALERLSANLREFREQVPPDVHIDVK